MTSSRKRRVHDRGRRGAAGRDESTLRRKTFVLDQSRIDRARRLLGAATDSETIRRALDEVIAHAELRDEALAAIEPLLGRSEIVNYFDDPAALDWSGFEPKPTSRKQVKSRRPMTAKAEHATGARKPKPF